MLKTNADKLVALSVMGEIPAAIWPASRLYRVGHDGVVRVLPGTGGICYSHVIGDSAVDLVGDHVEPGVSLSSPDKDIRSSLNTFSCVGNYAFVVAGAAKGDRGVVCGMHGGVDNVMVDFPASTLDKLVIGDKIQIRSFGTGLVLTDYPELRVLNCDPRIFKHWKIKPLKRGLEVPVSHIVPAKIMGSGLGAVTCHTGDYDIQLFDPQVVAEYNLNTLRFGDIVAIVDADHSHGRHYRQGAISVGVIVHSDSTMSGHGPGVTTLLTAADGSMLTPKISSAANIGNILKLGRWRKPSSSSAQGKRK
jgi:hypothetical protein